MFVGRARVALCRMNRIFPWVFDSHAVHQIEMCCCILVRLASRKKYNSGKFVERGLLGSRQSSVLLSLEFLGLRRIFQGTIFGLVKHLNMNALNFTLCKCGVENSRSDIEAGLGIGSPSINTSGSMIGTKPCSWQIAAYLARAWAFVEIFASLGIPSPILITAAILQI